MTELPDLQNKVDTRGIRIHKVGIRNYRMPFRVMVKDKEYIETMGEVSTYVSVEKALKGANMSRFSQVLMDVANSNDVSVDFIRNACMEMRERHEAIDAYVKVRFPYWTIKQAPVTKHESYSTHNCELEGRVVAGSSGAPKVDVFLTVEVEYMSCCPCSKEMSLVDVNSWPSDLGAEDRPGLGAHMQRSLARVKVHLSDPSKIVWIEELVAIVNASGSCEVFNVLKRPDEKWVTEVAYSNPKFCEDVVRDIGIALDELGEIIDGYVVVTEHKESIHQYNAVSVLRGGSFYIE